MQKKEISFAWKSRESFFFFISSTVAFFYHFANTYLPMILLLKSHAPYETRTNKKLVSFDTWTPSLTLKKKICTHSFSNEQHYYYHHDFIVIDAIAAAVVAAITITVINPIIFIFSEWRSENGSTYDTHINMHNNHNSKETLYLNFKQHISSNIKN